MFWKKKSIADAAGPISVPGFIGARVVEKMMKNPDLSDHWVEYKGVVRHRSNGDGICDIRIFDKWDTDHRGIKVTDFKFLDAHSDLIQFEGWFDEKSKRAEIKDLRKFENKP